MCDLSGGATPHGRNQYIERGEEVEIAERNSRGSSEKDHRVGSGVPSRGRCRGSLGQSSLRAVILRQPPTNKPDKRVASKLEGEGIADQGHKAIPKTKGQAQVERNPTTLEILTAKQLGR